ncbi:serine hydrolase-like protein isoform X2 [Epargyreus clarus]
MSALKSTEKQISIKAPWGKIAGLTWGDSKNPPVLLCPGRMEPCSAFRPLVQLLPSTFFYVAVDLPGNGWSDHLPKGVKYLVYDLVPTVVRVMEHYKWEQFMYIGHSLGAVVGKYFNMAYPGRMTRAVDLDPIPAYYTSRASRMGAWYHEYYGEYYSDEKYAKFNGSADTAPKYTYEQVRKMFIDTQGLTEEAAEHVLERSLEPAGDGLYRLTYDQRMKQVPLMPFPPSYVQELYTSTNIPIFGILAQHIINIGTYDDVPFIRDESAWPHKNYKVKIVEGNHDVHVNDPGCMADDISKFLLAGIKAKL